MEFRVLGALEILDDAGQAVALPAPRQRALMVLLTIWANRVIGVERLAEALWDGEPPASAVKSLRVHLSRLRRAIGGDRIQSLAHGYVFRLGTDECDATRFEHLTTDARAALGRGDPDGASTTLRKALDLWRGPALADVVGATWARPEIARLEEARLVALETRIEADLACGRHVDLVGELEALTSLHPLRERLWAARLLALYRSGRQAEALRAFQQVRSVLGDELGLEPGPDLMRLEAAIAARHPSLNRLPQSGTSESGWGRSVTLVLAEVDQAAELWTACPGPMAEALARLDAMTAQIVQANGGVQVRHRGEGAGSFSVFRRPLDAARAAVDVQLATRREQWPDDLPLQLRIAVHSGDADRDHGDYVGPTVDQAARLLAGAHGGQILLSGSTADLVREAIPSAVYLDDLGAQPLGGVGSAEKLYQLGHRAIPADFPHVRHQPSGRHNLPAPVSAFVGRELELRAILGRMKEHRLVTLTGPAGIGKSRIAMAVGERCVGDFDDGVWLVELAPVSNPELVIRAIATALTIHEQGGEELLDGVIRQLRTSRLLVILDNCEHLIDECAGIARELLLRCPELTMMATSRELLRIGGESVVKVGPMSLPAGEPPSTAAVIGSEAGALFVRRAGTVRPYFEVTSANASAISAILHRLDGVPLTIELAAARMASLAPRELLLRLDDRFRVLSGDARTVTGRHRTLRAAIDWSYDLLDADEQAVFRRLSVFAGGATLDAVETVCADDQLSPNRVVEVLTALVDKSLVVANSKDSGTRYVLLETLRQYAFERLAVSGESERTRGRHLAWATMLAEAGDAGLCGPDPQSWRTVLDADHGNFLEALEFATDRGRGDDGVRLALALGRYWAWTVHTPTGRRVLDRLLAVPDLDPLTRCLAMRLLGWLEVMQGATSATESRLKESLASAREANDATAIATACEALGSFERLHGRLTKADALLSEALSIYEQRGDRFGVATNLNRLGDIALERREPACRQLWELSLDIAQCEGALALEQMVTFNLGWLDERKGDLNRAQERFLRALDLTGRTGDQRLRSFIWAGLGWVSLGRGELASARLWFGQRLQFQEELNLRSDSGAERGMAWTAFAAGDYEAAEAWFQRELLAAETIGDPTERGDALAGLGRIALERRQPDRSLSLMEQALECARHVETLLTLVRVLDEYGEAARLAGALDVAAHLLSEVRDLKTSGPGEPWDASRATYNLGELARARGDREQAAALHREALMAQHAGGARAATVSSLEALAGLAGSTGSAKCGASLFGATRALRHGMGLVRHPSEQPMHDDAITLLRDHLGAASFEAAWRQGRSMSIETCVEFALDLDQSLPAAATVGVPQA